MEAEADLIAYLPEELRGPDTAIAKIAAGLSGAGVYRVMTAGRAFVLKVARGDEPLDAWQRRVHVQREAGAAGVAPQVVHADEAHRAVVSEMIADRSFIAYYMNPATRPAAIAELGATLRRVHELALPPGGESREPRQFLADMWSTFASFAVPAFVAEAVRDMLAVTPPPADRPLALCHNDVNPSNLAYDGARVLLLDWDTAGANDPLYDLAAAALFLRMDEPTCRALLAAHDGAPVAALPLRFGYLRRLVGVLCGVIFLHLARTGGHAGDASAAATPLAELYQQMRTGSLNVASAGGQFRFGLALVDAATAPVP
jgi:aminoglycoside phosphotransferase